MKLFRVHLEWPVQEGAFFAEASGAANTRLAILLLFANLPGDVRLVSAPPAALPRSLGGQRDLECRHDDKRHRGGLDLSPSGHWRDHTLANEPAPDDGPVLITIEYHIDPAEAAAFRAAMFHLRQTRLRDGAFRCSVFVDLDDPTLYRETFLVGSWAEHLRQHKRATMEDDRIERAALAFHRGPNPHVVQHLLMTSAEFRKALLLQQHRLRPDGVAALRIAAAWGGGELKLRHPGDVAVE